MALLSDRELDSIAALSDTTTLAGSVLQRLETGVERHRRIAEILVAHRDRLGLFSVGLDVVQQLAVMPMQRDPDVFADPDYASGISLDLLRRFMDNLHAEFTGGAVESHWARYFHLARRDDISPARVAMAGYNAHMTVDLAYSVAAVSSTESNADDFHRIVIAAAITGPAILSRTEEVYGTDLNPLWLFYFLGVGLDLVAGHGISTAPMLRAADLGYGVAIFANGCALRSERTRATAEIQAMFDTADAGFEVLTRSL